ncbi:MAG: hypothetical protein ACI3XD_10395, partial [Oscillospiraceae bacterium]
SNIILHLFDTVKCENANFGRKASNVVEPISLRFSSSRQTESIKRKMVCLPLDASGAFSRRRPLSSGEGFSDTLRGITFL